MYGDIPGAIGILTQKVRGHNNYRYSNKAIARRWRIVCIQKIHSMATYSYVYFFEYTLLPFSQENPQRASLINIYSTFFISFLNY
jgi:hypothetical protein